MRVAIVGSREFAQPELVRGFVRQLAAKYPDAVVVSGAARGVDRIAEAEAKLSGLSVLSFPADWDTHGKSAGFKRNAVIVANCDRLVAFWDGESKGTRHSIRLAQDKGLPVHIVRAE